MVVCIVVSLIFANGKALGIQEEKRLTYEDKIFDTSYVHDIQIVMDDWDEFLETATDEEYEVCDLLIDGKKQSNVAIRAKGNTSLSMVEKYENDRYSFKIEFDHYNEGNTYYGLDKLCLNNIISDNTYMKDYISYQMMRDAGARSPLCSYAYITVNGEPWGLYLAVEAIEDSFIERNYDETDGVLYKPESMGMGGGKGQGKDFRMSEFMEELENTDEDDSQIQMQEPPEMPDGQDRPENVGGPGDQGGLGGEEPPEMPDGQGRPEGKDRPEGPDGQGGTGGQGGPGGQGDSGDHDGQGGHGGMGSNDTKLVYTDDDPDSYSVLRESAKTKCTDDDFDRLIASLKKLNNQEDIEEVVDTDNVIKYFAVHNFLLNGDSYTGQMIHNYYLYERSGMLDMLPWDYNLAFGGFSGGDATSVINEDIYSPVSGGYEDRPMLAWILDSEKYTEQYTKVISEYLAKWYDTGYYEQYIEDTYEMIAPYVKDDPTAFCTFEEFEKGVETLKTVWGLRAEAVSNQLSGDYTEVDASGVNLKDMGSQMGGGDHKGRP